MIVAVTGHRPQSLAKYPDHESHIRQFFKKAFSRLAPTEVVSGMALGVDQWAAEEALEAGVRLTAAVPYQSQPLRWLEANVAQYMAILEKAHQIEILFDNPTSRWEAVASLQKRNIWMVDRADIILGVWDGNKGGTGNCIKYASQVKRKVIRLNPQTWAVDAFAFK